MLNNGNIYRKAIPLYIYLANFIMNRVPSDIYRLKNPKLAIDSNDALMNANSPAV
jgi:hypothetical protein